MTLWEQVCEIAGRRTDTRQAHRVNDTLTQAQALDSLAIIAFEDQWIGFDASVIRYARYVYLTKGSVATNEPSLIKDWRYV